MSNPNIIPRLKKGDPKTKEIASKGGKARKGTYSIKTAMKRALESGKISVDELAQAFLLQAKEGNGAYAKLALEYLDGKVTDKIEHTGKDGNPIETHNLSKEEYANLRKKMIKDDDV